MNDLKETFDKIVKNHKVQIIKDDGLYRHISATENGSAIYRFDLITWPGYLAYTGDMGHFVFARIPDMFAFFRGREINPGYWAEKVLAENIHNGIEEFSVDVFRENVLHDARSYLDLEENEPLPDDIQEEIRVLLDAEDEWECVEEMRRFSSEKIKFHDFWECRTTEYTDTYLMACYAIVWAIAQYDALKGGTQ